MNQLIAVNISYSYDNILCILKSVLHEVSMSNDHNLLSSQIWNSTDSISATCSAIQMHITVNVTTHTLWSTFQRQTAVEQVEDNRHRTD